MKIITRDPGALADKLEQVWERFDLETTSDEDETFVHVIGALREIAAKERESDAD